MSIISAENRFSYCDFNPVEFHNKIHPRIKIYPMYFKLGFNPSPRVFGRQIIIKKLLNALDILPTEYGLLIWDIYRPRLVQAQLFDWMRNEIRQKYPQLNEEQNYVETCKYASPPSKIGDEYCPPHLSGGAIDLTLFNTSNGIALEMGTAFDDCTERAHSNYFNLISNLTIEEENIKTTRNLLRTTMEKVGFVSYQYEWWHFDIGNILWSRMTGYPAIFGPLFNDEGLM